MRRLEQSAATRLRVLAAMFALSCGFVFAVTPLAVTLWPAAAVAQQRPNILVING